ncbi:VTT domain-containing protein [Litorihabitans aurantiacus]|uniref:VTT domain-containing protein n=1 Tax=Litorihabitans aurantiacus TaxID=1930061 RepID=A0AA37XDT1_9MICO|nr:VTT domain-containing protein [Litorihabitans aurantiacus]GMA30977.1 hypothetical protein GCM10025875_09690 [Litorihabitans aurantiacus]
MPAALDGASFWPLFAFFLGVVLLRTQLTYWIARLVTRWSLDHTRPRRPWVTRVHRWLQGEGTARGLRTVERWGVVAVPLSFLATGTKTVVNAAAGVVAMPFAKYLPAMLLGCVAHAVIYATVGWAAWSAALAAATGSPWGLAVLALIALAVAFWIVLRVRARRRDAGLAP